MPGFAACAAALALVMLAVASSAAINFFAFMPRLIGGRRSSLIAVRSLHDHGDSGSEIPNRVMLAPLAGIGNWFVRLQAKRYGAGLAVSEMISSFAIHYGNARRSTSCWRAPRRGPSRSSCSGTTRRSCAPRRRRGPWWRAILDLNMGCPVPKVMKTGAGAAMIKDPDLAVAVARAAREGSGCR